MPRRVSPIERISHWTKSLLYDVKFTYVLGIILFNLELLQNFFIINKVSYTEIDWKAYMDECSGFLNGTTDYMLLKGDTGPLVYPAGFVYIFSALYYITGHGANIRLAQYIFLVFYMINLALVIRIYNKTAKCPPYVFIFMCCASKRVHSIFVLRLFNDPVAMILFFIALNLFLDKRWTLGCVMFSAAVSVKMNIMLFSPGLFLVLIIEIGVVKTIAHIALCGLIQVLLGLPFLIENASGYLLRSFELSRQFDFKWTVNWRMLSAEVFADRRFHFMLLALHLAVLLLFAATKWKKNMKSLFGLLDYRKFEPTKLTSEEIVRVLFICNFVGIVFSRSLHYQFYIWYYHTLPYLLWCCNYSSAFRLLILGLIEMCWNIYPSTVISSTILHICHAAILFGLWKSDTQLLAQNDKKIQ